MNSKAEKTTLFGVDKPPLLCLSKSTPSIDNTYNQLEANNSPFLNSYMSPLYRQDIKGESVFDRYGHRYYTKDGAFYREDVKLFNVENKHFEIEEVTDDYLGYLDFDIDDSDTAYVIFNEETNTIQLSYKGRLSTSQKLFNEGVIVKTRVRILDDIAVAVVVYKNEDDSYRYTYISLSESGDEINFINQSLTWYYGTIRTSPSTAVANTITSTSTTPNNLLIQIAKVYQDVIGFTILSDYGVVSRSNNLFFHTAVCYDNQLYVLKGSASGRTLIPQNTPQPQIITTQYSSYFNITYGFQGRIATYAALSSDENTFYEYDEEGVLGDEIDFPIEYSPDRTSETVTIDGVVYTKYIYQGLYQRSIATISNTATGDTAQWGAIASIGGGVVSSEVVSSETDTSVTIDVEKRTPGVLVATDLNFDQVVVWLNTTDNSATFDSSIAHLSYTKSTTSNVGWLTFPNIIMDNGNMYSTWRFNTTATALTAGNQFIESGKINSLSLNSVETLTFGVDAIEAFTLPVSSFKIRSNSYTILPNFFSTTVRGTTTTTAFTAAPANGYTNVWFNSSASDRVFMQGTHNTTELYNSATIFDNYVAYTPGGFRAQIKNTKWNILPFIINSDVSNLGISYSTDSEAMGTMLSPWTDIDQDFYIKANSDSVIYRDSLNRLWKISIVEGVEYYAISRDRYIILNTTSYFNCWDSLLNKKFHYASDYNDRLLHGYSVWNVGSANANINIRTRATAINAGYKQNTRLNLASSQFPSLVVSRCETEQYHLHGCRVSEDIDTQAIDVYYTDTTQTATDSYSSTAAIKYRYSVYPYHIVDSVVETSLQGTTYQNNTTMFAPTIFSRIVNGAANNDFVIQNNTSYPLVYFNGSPILLYTLQSGQELSEARDFFVLQGQFYGVIGEKIYSLIYVDNSLSEMDAIVDIRGFQFIGNTPQIAFFWSPSLRAIFSFTGDAVLQPLFSANKIDSIQGNYFYDESSMSIWIPTDVGILVLGSKNTFILPDYTNIQRIQFDENGITHVIDENTHNLSYYPKDDYKSNHVIAETSFFGIGANQSTTIDRWNITLYNPYDVDLSGNLKLAVKSITNTMTTSEEKTMRIDKTKWDKESHAILVSYSPQLIKGQGIRLLIDSPWIVASVIPHIQDNGTSQNTNRQFEI